MNKAKKIKHPLILVFILYTIFIFLELIPSILNGEKFSSLIIEFGYIILLFEAPFLIFVLGYKSAKTVVRYESLNKIDFVNDKKYYRDIIKKYSISELLYIDKFLDNEEKKAIVLILLKLQLLGRIKISDAGIEIIDNNLDGLKKSEAYVLNHINNNKVNFDVDGYTYFYTKKDAVDDNLIQDVTNFKSYYLYKFIFIAFFIIVLVLSGWGLSSNNTFMSKISFISLINCFVVFPGFYYAFTRTYYYRKKDAYIRTPLGEEINQKLNGLKNYINDFGNLSDVDQKSLIMWDDYLIYSVMFGINNKVYDNLVDLINIEFEHGVLYYSKK